MLKKNKCCDVILMSQARDIIMEKIDLILERNGYHYVKTSSSEGRTSFDIIARKKDLILILKIEPYIDNFNKENSQELINIAQFLNASPMIIGVKGRSDRIGQIEDGLVLLRYGIPVISPETFLNLIHFNIPPIIYCKRGGYYVQIDRKELTRARLEKNLSYADLARLINVSRTTVYEYEHSINPSPDIVADLEEILGVDLTEGIDIFSYDFNELEIPPYKKKPLTNMKEEISSSLEDLGVIFQYWTKLSPFDAFGEHHNKDERSGLNILLCINEENIVSSSKFKIDITNKIASLTKRRALMVVESKDHPFASNIPTFTVDELQNIRKAFDFVREWVAKHDSIKKAEKKTKKEETDEEE